MPLQMSGWDIPIAAAQFVGVTGISEADGAQAAQVEYTYRWNPTEFAQKLGRIPDGTPKSGSAQFQRYDDGWRLQSVGFLGVLSEPQFSEPSPARAAPGPRAAAPLTIPRGPSPSTNTERLVDRARQEIVDGNTDDAALLIRQVGALHGDLNYKQDVSLLYVAIANQHLDLATLLLDLGASPDVGDSHGETLLMKAVLDGNPDSVDVLLAHKANPNLATRSGETALQFALKNTFPIGQRMVTSLRKAGAQR